MCTGMTDIQYVEIIEALETQNALIAVLIGLIIGITISKIIFRIGEKAL